MTTLPPRVADFLSQRAVTDVEAIVGDAKLDETEADEIVPDLFPFAYCKAELWSDTCQRGGAQNDSSEWKSDWKYSRLSIDVVGLAS